MENKKAILLLSGGIDSTTLLAKLMSENYDLLALSFDYGQKHILEIEYAKKQTKKYNANHIILKLDNKGFGASALVNPTLAVSIYDSNSLPTSETNAYVPFRNLIFISNALSIAESLAITDIFVAFNKEDSLNFWDCKIEFIEIINQIAGYKGIRILSPFINLEKKEIIQLALHLNVNLEQTLTCYQPIGYDECGKCLSCITKRQALNNIQYS